MRRRNGFSLAEVLAVLAIAAIVLAIVAPRLHGWVVHLRTRAAVNRVATDLAYTRMLAVREGTRVRLVIEPDPTCPAPTPGAAGHRYRIVVGEGREVRSVDLRGQGGRVCLASNRGAEVPFNSRGLLVGHNNRTMVVREGTHAADTLSLSILGRVLRRY